MASTQERLLGFVQRRIMTEQGWVYHCSECCVYHPIENFYKNANRPFGIFSSCSKMKGKGSKTKPKIDPSLAKMDTTGLKLNKVTEDDVKNTIEFLELIGYDTTGNVHEQFKIKYQYEIEKALSKRPENSKPSRTKRK
jgi:hypothetical protein